MIAKDVLGREIEVGDLVVYPTRFASFMEMKAGLVESLEVIDDPYTFESKPFIKVRSKKGRLVPVYRLERVAIVQKWRIRDHRATDNEMQEVRYLP